MNWKKMAVTLLAVVWASVNVLAMETVFLSTQQIRTKLQRNEILPSVYLDAFGSREIKSSLGKLAQQQVKQHRNYVAYYNAAVIYLTNAEVFDDASSDLTATDLANVKKYASEAIKISPRSPDMYLVRGMALDKFLNFGAASNMSYVGRDVYTPLVKQHSKEVREILKDYEMVGKLQPDLAPWSTMASFYEILGDKENAKRCNSKDQAYARLAEERVRKAEQGKKAVVSTLFQRMAEPFKSLGFFK